MAQRQLTTSIGQSKTYPLIQVGAVFLKKPAAVQHKGYRPVVNTSDVHVGGEFTGGAVNALLTNQLHGFPIEHFGRLRRGGLIKSRPTTLAAIAVKGELAYQQDCPVDILHALVHLVVFVGEYPQIDEFFRDELGVGDLVVLAYPQINQEALPDAADYFTCYFHLCLADALYYCSHDDSLI